jgi:hypothetical protein
MRERDIYSAYLERVALLFVYVTFVSPSSATMINDEEEKVKHEQQVESLECNR